VSRTVRSYPTALRGTIIGRPFQGTHTLGNWQSDRAYDIRVPIGTPVQAIWDGVIGSRIGPISPGGGRFGGIRVYVEVPNGNAFYYAHLSRLARGIRPGVHVRSGQIIGYTGEASGVPHLHVSCMKGDPHTKLLSGRLHVLRQTLGVARSLIPSLGTDDTVEPEDWECADAVPDGEGEPYSGRPPHV
jgi:murein DD-endopeptidase MepM/ murein hydrolase activator NlpD